MIVRRTPVRGDRYPSDMTVYERSALLMVYSFGTLHPGKGYCTYENIGVSYRDCDELVKMGLLAKSRVAREPHLAKYYLTRLGTSLARSIRGY